MVAQKSEAAYGTVYHIDVLLLSPLVFQLQVVYADQCGYVADELLCQWVFQLRVIAADSLDLLKTSFSVSGRFSFKSLLLTHPELMKTIFSVTGHFSAESLLPTAAVLFAPYARKAMCACVNLNVSVAPYGL